MYPDAIVCDAGDFNLPGTTWSWDSENHYATYHSPSTLETQVCDSIVFAGLSQFNIVPNYYNQSTLDLIWCNNQLIVEKSSYSFVSVDVYHPPLEFVFIVENSYNCPIIQDNAWKFDFKKANFDMVNEFFYSINWNYILSHTTHVDEFVSVFYDYLFYASDKFIPKFLVNCTKFPSWYSADTKKSIKLKNKLHRKFKKSNSPANYETYKVHRSHTSYLIKHDYERFISRTEENVKSNPKLFWSFINSKRSSIKGIPNRVSLDGVLADDPFDTCNLFADFFSSVYVQYSASTRFDLDPMHYDNPHILDSIDITPDKVFEKLISLKDSYASGPDGVCTYFLKECSPSLSYPISLIFQYSLLSGCFPSPWKNSFVVPLHKGNDPQDIRNYRPISCLSAISKIFESFISDAIFKTYKHSICSEQHGFFAGRSIETNLLLYIDSIVEAVEVGKQVDAVYVDFEKAFDRIDHSLLCHKLALFGISGNLLKLIQSYLSNRTQQVKIHQYLSRPFAVPSGVPQGSHCAPVFFALFINDLSFHLSSQFLFFADDLKLFRIVDTGLDTSGLQNDIDALLAWCSANRMTLNINKCKTISFHRRTSPVLFSYNIRGLPLERVTSIRDLGIIFHSQVKFDAHIDEIVRRAMKMCGFIKRQTCDFSDILSIVTLYQALVRPILEFGSLIWNPYYNIYIDRIERVQRKMANYILYKLNIDKNLLEYPERISIIGLQSLYKRRDNRCILFASKVLNGAVESSSIVSRFALRVPPYVVRNKLFLEEDHHRTNYGLHSPFNVIFMQVNLVASKFDFFSLSLGSLRNALKE